MLVLCKMRSEINLLLKSKTSHMRRLMNVSINLKHKFIQISKRKIISLLSSLLSTKSHVMHVVNAGSMTKTLSEKLINKFVRAIDDQDCERRFFVFK